MQYRIGVDFGGTAIKAGLVDEANRIVLRHSRPARKGLDPIAEDICAEVRTLAEQAGIGIASLPCVGVGLPGGVDPQRGVVRFAGNTGLTDAPLREVLRQKLGIPVYIGNDANCAAIGEAVAGGAQGCKNVLLLTLGTGIGGGVILDGKLFCGADGLGTELGHIPLIAGGEPCSCGIDGCFEAYASVTALIRQTRAAMAAAPDSLMHDYARDSERGRVTGRTAFESAKMGDAAALAVVERYIEYLSRGIGGLISIFRPETVLIGGGLSAQGEYLLSPLNDRVRDHAFAGRRIGVPPIKRALLGNDAGTVGAACLDRM